MGLIIVLLIILIILVIIVLNKSNQNSEKISQLKWELNKLLNQIKSIPKSETKFSNKIQEEKESVSLTSPISHDIEKQSPVSINDELVTQISAKPSSTPTEQIKTVKEKKSLSKDEWEILIGGKLLNRIGALALIIALGYFLKYAFDNNLISETIRVLIGVAVGLLLIAGGFRFYKKDFIIFYQGLVGAGIAILYLSIYSSFNYYNLVSQPVAIIFMALVTIITFIQAFYYNSIAVAFFGWIGGFLTPFLLNMVEANEIRLFTYIFLVALGLIFIVIKKDRWIVLEVLTIAATYIVFYNWFNEFYSQEKLFVSILFLSVFWILFFVTNLFHVYNATRTYVELRQIFAAINIALYYMGLYLMIDSKYHEWMGLITLTLSLIYFGTYFLFKKRQKLFTYQQIFSIIIGISLLTLSIAVQFENYLMLTFWALEAIIILWLGITYKIKFLWIVGNIFSVIILITLITRPETFNFSPIKEFNPVFNLRALSLISVSILFGLGAFLYSNFNIKKSLKLRIIFYSTMCTLLIIFSIAEIGDYFKKLALLDKTYDKHQIVFLKSLTWSIGYTVLSLFLMFFGYRMKFVELVIFGLITLGFGVLSVIVFGITYVPIEQYTAIVNFRTLVYFVILIGMSVQLFWLRKSQNLFDWLDDIYKILQVGLIIILLAMLTGEIRDFFEKEILFLDPNSAEYLSKINLQQMFLSSGWLLFSIIMLVFGIWKRIQTIRITAIIIFGIAILKMFLYDLSYLETLYRIISFMGLGLILLFASYLYQKYKNILF